ncbi:MAG: HAD family hydrolase [Pseudomonadota bacterium]
MELLVFDLDGTLLDGRGRLSARTTATLLALRRSGIAYTVATGRTFQECRGLLGALEIGLPQIYANGVVVWDPVLARFTQQCFLTPPEVERTITAALQTNLSPLVHTIDPTHHHAVYHPPIKDELLDRWTRTFEAELGLELRPLPRLPADADITNIFMLGDGAAITHVHDQIDAQDHLVAYGGEASESPGWRWLDVHHTNASKGKALRFLKQQMAVSRVVCFGDADNDLSLFAQADESYAPANATASAKAAATAVIAHHNEDGVAEFLRHRYALDR